MITLCAEILHEERSSFLKTDLGKLCCVTSCGSCLDGKQDHLERALGWFDTMLLYVTVGSVKLTIKGQKPMEVTAGEVAVVPDSVPYKMENPEGRRYYFVHFTLGLPLSDFKIPPKQSFYVGDQKNLGELFHKIIFSLKLGTQNLHFSSVYMLELLCEIGLAFERANGYHAYKDRFDEVIGIMEDSCRGEAQIGDFAQMCGMSERSFRDEFFKRKGVSPKQFLISSKVELLKNHIEEYPRAPLKNLSATCGFSNYKYAVNLFRRETGLTPQQYRDSIRGLPEKKRYIHSNVLPKQEE